MNTVEKEKQNKDKRSNNDNNISGQKYIRHIYMTC